jgi:hypothetical protein
MKNMKDLKSTVRKNRMELTNILKKFIFIENALGRDEDGDSSGYLQIQIHKLELFFVPMNTEITARIRKYGAQEGRKRAIEVSCILDLGIDEPWRF